MTLCCLMDIDLYQKIHNAIWCLLGYICSCFLHTLDRLVRDFVLYRESREGLQDANKSWFTVTEILQKSVLNTITLAPQKKNQENHTIDIIYPQIFIHHSILILILLIFQYCVSAIEISMLDFLSGKSFLWNLKAFLNQFKLKAMAVCAKNHQP